MNYQPAEARRKNTHEAWQAQLFSPETHILVLFFLLFLLWRLWRFFPPEQTEHCIAHTRRAWRAQPCKLMVWGFRGLGFYTSNLQRNPLSILQQISQVQIKAYRYWFCSIRWPLLILRLSTCIMLIIRLLILRRRNFLHSLFRPHLAHIHPHQQKKNPKYLLVFPPKPYFWSHTTQGMSYSPEIV